MEEEFYKDEFEQFLQQQANNHRMFPTDSVWLGIYKKLHGNKRWPGLTIAAFAILIATVATSLYFSPKPNIFALDQVNIIVEKTGSPKKSNALLNLVSMENNDTKGKNLVEQTPDNSNGTINEKMVMPSVTTDLLVPTDDNQKTVNSLKTVDIAKQPINIISSIENQTSEKVQAKKIAATAVLEQGKIIKVENSDVFDNEEINFSLNLADIQPGSGKPNIAKPNTIKKIKGDPDDRNLADKFLKQHRTDLADFTTTKITRQKNKFSYTVYIAPSVSYRKLKEDKNLNSKSYSLTGPVAPNFVTDVNRLVRHKPGTGIEAGLAFTYHLSNTFGIKSGVQFNIRQYNIEAFKSSTELTSIALLSNSGVDTIKTYATYRNNNGNFSTELVNRYYQFSIPVGIVWEVLGNKKVQFNVAANIQPTYTFNSDSYVLSTNFKNYTINSGMLRNWTINSNIETYLSLKVGEYKWQLGPQLRYQHLPTFITEYPIREHLMDYGFKIGVSKQIK